MQPPPNRKPLSELTPGELRARAAEMRRMAETATTERIRAALRRLADRFERLADDHGRDHE